MPIIAPFVAGQREITVNGLHQWDYGQTLEIHAEFKTSVIVRVHFACLGMDEAVVRTCETTTNKAVVSIPDRCLEQTTPITAWVFENDPESLTGTTTKKITLPIEAKTRPSVSEDVPAEVEDQIGEYIQAVNAAINNLKNGSVKAAAATKADNADKADVAQYATAADKQASKTIDSRLVAMEKAKGSIEERLTALGFKEGVVTPVTGSATNIEVKDNVIKRQGNYVIGHFSATGLFPTYTDSATNAYKVPMCTVPEEFRPTSTKAFYGYIEYILGGIPYVGSCMIEITPEGVLRYAGESMTSSFFVTGVRVSFGYDASI